MLIFQKNCKNVASRMPIYIYNHFEIILVKSINIARKKKLVDIIATPFVFNVTLDTIH